jgi:hypothetical protein
MVRSALSFLWLGENTTLSNSQFGHIVDQSCSWEGQNPWRTVEGDKETKEEDIPE